MKKLTLFIIFIITFSANCSKDKWEGRIYKEQGVTVIESKGSGLWGEKINEKIKFTENLSLGVEEGEEYLLFHDELDTAVDSELNIYVLDAKNQRLLKFDKQGNYTWKTGRKGQGPGEFRNPSEVIVSPSGEIWVLDSPSLVHVFDMRGKFQRTINLEGLCSNFQFLPDGRLFIGRPMRGQLGIAAEYYSSQGKFIEKFPDEYRYGPKLPSWAGGGFGGGFRFLEGKIYMIIPDKYEIREYGLEGKLLGKTKRDFKLKPPEIKQFKRGFTMSTLNVIGPCFLYKGKMLLNTLMLVERKAEGEFKLNIFLDFFNEKRQFLGSYKLPEETWLNSIDSENNFYFVQRDPFPRIIRSTLDIE